MTALNGSSLQICIRPAKYLILDQVVFEDDDEVVRGVTLLGVEKEGPRSMVGSKAASHVKSSGPIMEVTSVGYKAACKAIADWLHSSGAYVAPVITIEPPLFYYTGETKYSAITRDDLEEFLRGDCINVSILHVYQLYLMEEYAKFFDRGFVSMLYPVRLSTGIAKTEPASYRAYLTDAFLTEMRKGGKQCKFLLASYNEGAHWMLFVIELQLGEVYVFNSIRSDNLCNLQIYNFLKLAFRVYQSQDGQCETTSSGELNFTKMKNYFGSHSAYTSEEIDMVREQWAKFFLRRWTA